MGNVDTVLKSKYGISEREIDEIIKTSKSQPEAIAKLRKRLHGSTKYDPRYFEVERLLTAKWDVKTHGYLPDTHERVKRLEASMTLKPGEYIDAEGRVHKEVKKNTGVKTVPKPRPELIKRIEEEKRFFLHPAPNPTVPKPSEVHIMAKQGQPERKGLPSWIILVGVLAGLYVISRRR